MYIWPDVLCFLESRIVGRVNSCDSFTPRSPTGVSLPSTVDVAAGKSSGYASDDCLSVIGLLFVLLCKQIAGKHGGSTLTYVCGDGWWWGVILRRRWVSWGFVGFVSCSAWSGASVYCTSCSALSWNLGTLDMDLEPWTCTSLSRGRMLEANFLLEFPFQARIWGEKVSTVVTNSRVFTFWNGVRWGEGVLPQWALLGSVGPVWVDVRRTGCHILPKSTTWSSTIKIQESSTDAALRKESCFVNRFDFLIWFDPSSV